MAKSIRSKWRRKCRAVKRVRYGQKELERLKKTLGIDENGSKLTDAPIEEMAEVITFTTADEIKEKKKSNEKNTDGMILDVDMNEIKKKYNPRTLRNENGAYPVWVHPRKIKKAKHRKGKGKGRGKGKKHGKNT